MRSQGGKRNFHVPLPEDIYSELNHAAHELKLPATQLARRVIESWLKEAKRFALEKEIEAYADAIAGTQSDLDQALEEAGIEALMNQGKSKKKKRKYPT